MRTLNICISLLASLPLPLLFQATVLGEPQASLKVAPGSPGYTFRKIAFQGDAIPGGGELTGYFEPGLINNAGAITFVADVTESGGQAAFIVDESGAMTVMARTGSPAPGGGKFGLGSRGMVLLNDAGDSAFTFMLEGSDLSAGVYRYLHETGKVNGVVLPDQLAPRGGIIMGFDQSSMINDRGEVLCIAYVDDDFPDLILHPPDFPGVGMELLLLGTDGKLSCILRPGDPGTAGKTFDFFSNPHMNDSGDITFGGHLAGCPCVQLGWICGDNIFLRKASGEIIPIALTGDPAPGGGVYRIAFGPIVNSRGEVAFTGDLTDNPDPNYTGDALGVFLYKEGDVIAVGRPGDLMPGGGKYVNGSFFVDGHWLNDPGEVSFNATLDTLHDRDGDGVPDVPDQGLYLWSNGNLRLVARSGTVIEGLGKVMAFLPPVLYLDAYPKDFPWPYVGTIVNSLGQILLSPCVKDEKGEIKGALVVATPVTPHFYLGHARIRDGTFEAVLSTSERVTGLSFGLILDGSCTARIRSVEPGADFPGVPEVWSVRLSEDGKSAAVEGQVSPMISVSLGPGENLRVATVRLSDLSTQPADCRLCFADGGDPPISISIVTPDGARAATNGGCLEVPESTPPIFLRGDASIDGKHDLSDPIFILQYFFLSGEAPSCMDTADADDTGVLDLTDAIWLLNYLFLAGPPPADPFPSCGVDPSGGDPLDCASYDRCWIVPKAAAAACGR